MEDHLYYQHVRNKPLTQRISYRVRMEIIRLFFARFQPGPATRVIDVGVSLDVGNFESNALEQVYPHRDQLTCVGIGDGRAVIQAYPGVTFVQVEPGEKLPFPDGHFDIAYSNAVVEHVGAEARQRAFVHELCRVGKKVFITTPNRLFPIEHHTGLPLVHYLPLGTMRWLLGKTSYRFWSKEDHLNPLRAGQLKHLFPDTRPAEITGCGLGLPPWRSNLVAIA